jgi:hypothetical protein
VQILEDLHGSAQLPPTSSLRDELRARRSLAFDDAWALPIVAADDVTDLDTASQIGEEDQLTILGVSSSDLQRIPEAIALSEQGRWISGVFPELPDGVLVEQSPS